MPIFLPLEGSGAGTDAASRRQVGNPTLQGFVRPAFVIVVVFLNCLTYSVQCN